MWKVGECGDGGEGGFELLDIEISLFEIEWWWNMEKLGCNILYFLWVGIVIFDEEFKEVEVGLVVVDSRLDLFGFLEIVKVGIIWI